VIRCCVGVVMLCAATATGSADTTVVARLSAVLAGSEGLILGEDHHRPESPVLLADLVEHHLRQGACLSVALEIASDQQATLDAFVAGNAPVGAIPVHTIVDHPGYREMLVRLRDQVTRRGCLSVHAIDAPTAVPQSRDEWMAERIMALRQRGRPVLALVGNLHVLKKVRWQSGRDNPFVAERLARAGMRVTSVLQDWDRGCAERLGAWLDMREPRAVAALNATVGVAAVHPPAHPEAVADGVVAWQCRGGG
jgi:hypothetical protein